MFTLDRKLIIRMMLLVLGILVAVLMIARIFTATATTSAAPSANPIVVAQVLDASCDTSVGIDSTGFTKVVEIGSFNVQSAESLVEVTFNGRIYVASFTGSTGARFELRVDDLATTSGRARAIIKNAEAGSGLGMPAIMTGIFDSLAPGLHTVSIWAESAQGTGTGAQIDPGCWSSDHVVIKEYLPFGTVAVPVALSEE